MRSITWFAALLVLAVASPAMAEPSVKQYLESSGEERTILTVYIIATEQAFAWSNASLENRGDAPLYCVPARLALTDDQVLDIVARFTEAKATELSEDEMYLALFVLFAMQDAFPCGRQVA